MTLTAPIVDTTALPFPSAAGTRVEDPGPRSARVEAMGVGIDRLDVDEARARVDAVRRQPGCARVAFVNAHSVNLSHDDAAYRAALRRTDLVLNDGAGVAVLGRVLGTPFPANLNGTDFIPRLLADLPVGTRVFLYGGRPGVAERAGSALFRAHPQLVPVGTLDGYGPGGDEAAGVIRRAGAQVVLVALGNPRQELWADRHGERTGAALVLSVGAFLDFTAGEVVRAPRVVRAARLEWVFRLLQEPRRLFRRYVWGVPLFLARVARARLVPRPDPGFVVYEYPPEARLFAA